MSLFAGTAIRRCPFAVRQSCKRLRSDISAPRARQPISSPSPPPSPADIATHDAPAPWQRGAQAAGFVLSGFAGLYAVLFYDFGEGEHCFQPIRREYNKLVDTFLDVDGTQTERLQKKEKLSAMMSGELKERIKAETLERERTELARTKEAAAKSEARLV